MVQTYRKQSWFPSWFPFSRVNTAENVSLPVARDSRVHSFASVSGSDSLMAKCRITWIFELASHNVSLCRSWDRKEVYRLNFLFVGRLTMTVRETTSGRKALMISGELVEYIPYIPLGAMYTIILLKLMLWLSGKLMQNRSLKLNISDKR